MEMEKLAAEAAVAAVKELAVSGVKGGLAVGGRLWAWIKGRAPEAENATLEAVETNPQKPSAEDKVRAVLKDLLHDDPALQEELTAIVKEAGDAGTTQTTTAVGDNNIQTPIAGNENTVNIRR